MAEKPDFKKIINDKLKDPQLRFVIILIATSIIFMFWNQISKTGDYREYNISYSQFLEQLNSNNIYSVTIKNLHLRGGTDLSLYVLFGILLPKARP